MGTHDLFSYDEIALVAADHAHTAINYLDSFRSESADPVLLVQAFTAVERSRLILVQAIQEFPPEVAEEVRAWMAGEEASESAQASPAPNQAPLNKYSTPKYSTPKHDCPHCEDHGCPACNEELYLEMQRMLQLQQQEQDLARREAELAAKLTQQSQAPVAPVTPQSLDPDEEGLLPVPIPSHQS